jgi:hypothetical protein
MGKILPSYKKAMFEELADNIAANSSQYYAFAANPIAYTGNTAPAVTSDDYSTLFVNDWKMLFGKRLQSSDFAPVIENNRWTSNTVYDRYDNTSNTVIANNNFYVVSSPSIVGGSYHVYKCIDNAKGSASTVDPGTIGTPTQPSTFETSDLYKWRYVGSVTAANYDKFAANNFIPIYPNTTIVSTAASYSGVEVVAVANAGVGYATYTNGVIQSVQNSTLIQIASYSSENNDYYVNNAIYVYNSYDTTSQLSIITNYTSNGSGKWVSVAPALNTSSITSGISQYIISPQVYFESDGGSQPKAYSTINTTSNSIQSIVMLDIGTNISWANVRIISNNAFGTGANLYAIVPPPGGHGADPIAELNAKGFAINFAFSNTEANTITTSNVVFNKIGLIKNPYAISANVAVDSTTISKGARYYGNTFDQVLKANVGTSFTFTKGETITGVDSGAKGIVVFSNTSQVYIVGDKHFIDGENVANNNGNITTTISFNANNIGDVYTKDLKPFYIDNINNVNRSDTQTEIFKLIIEI